MRVLLLAGSFVMGSVLALPGSLLGYVNSVAFSPDGKALAVTAANNVVILDTATLTRRRILTGHGDAVVSVAYSPDGALLAAASTDKTVLLWETNTWQRVHMLAEPKAKVYCIAFTAGGKTLVTGLSDGNIRFWNVAQEAQERTFRDQTAVHHLAFSRDGKLLAAGLSDDRSHDFSRKDTTSVWEVATGKRLHQLVSPAYMLSHVTFSPNGKTLATADTLAVTLWDPTTGNRQQPLANPGWAWAYKGLAFSPNGETLAAGSMEGLFLWDVATRKLRRKVVELKETTCLAFSPDGTMLAVGRQDGFFGLFNAATGESLRLPQPPDVYRESPHSVAFGQDGKTLAVGMFSEVVLCDLATGKVQDTLGRRHDQHCGEYEVAFSPDGAQLIGWLGPPWPFGPVQFWNCLDRKDLQTLKVKDSEVFALAPDGATFAIASPRGGVFLWDTRKKAQRRSLRVGEDEEIRSAAFSPDGKLVGAATGESGVILWDVATGMRLRTLAVAESQAVCLKFSPDSKTLATAQEGGAIILWDPATGVQRRALIGHLGEVQCMAFSPDGKTLASGGTDAAVVLWTPVTGLARRKLIAHTCPVSSVAFSRDGKFLASAPYGGSVILWDAATGALLRTVASCGKQAGAVVPLRDARDPFTH